MRALSPLVLITALATQAQDLVPNGDFESYTQCPDYVSQIDRATGWSRPTGGTSDYFNACLGVPFSESVPDNEFGYEPAHSGNGYAGFYGFVANTASEVPGDEYREYVAHSLAAPLIPGETYSVEFFVSLSDVSHYAVNDVGALFSMQPPHRADDHTITSTPQVMNTSLTMLNNKNGWTRISGCFVADSAFTTITIGNFHESPAIVYEEVPTNFPLLYYSYYYVDDVSVQHLTSPMLGPDTTACGPVVLSVLDPEPGAEYTWNTGGTGPSIIADTAGTYSVVRDADGCVLGDTVVVDIAAPLRISLQDEYAVDFCTTPSILIGPDSLPVEAVVLWSTGATSPQLLVNAAGDYSITATSPGYCPGHATTEVTDTCRSPVYAPTAFTPNGDGINDQWQPVWTANGTATLELSIYDRWGRMLFTSTDGNAAWDGTAEGSPVPIGVYAWRGHTRDPGTGMDVLLHGRIDLLR